MPNARMVFTKSLPRDRRHERNAQLNKGSCLLFFFLSVRKTKPLLTGGEKSLGFVAHNSRFSPAYISLLLFQQFAVLNLQDLKGVTAVSVSNPWEGSRDNLVLSDLSLKNDSDWDVRRIRSKLDQTSFVPGRPRVFSQTFAAI